MVYLEAMLLIGKSLGFILPEYDDEFKSHLKEYMEKQPKSARKVLKIWETEITDDSFNGMVKTIFNHPEGFTNMLAQYQGLFDREIKKQIKKQLDYLAKLN